MALFALAARGEADGEAFRHQLIDDLRRGAEHEHAAVGKVPPVTHVWVLAAMVRLHAQTGDGRYLDWAKDDLLRMVRDAASSGKPKALFVSFRYLPPLCETF